MKLIEIFSLNLVLLCMSGCGLYRINKCNIEMNDPCPCSAAPIVEYDEMGEFISDIDLDNALQPDQKVVLRNGKAAVKLCQSSDGSIEIYKCISERFGERGIIIRYYIEDKRNIRYLDEICLRNTAKILKLKNGDALLSLLQGVGTGFYVNKLFVLHINDEDNIVPFEVKIDEIFKQVKEKTELNLSFEKKVVTVTDPESHQSASFFLTKDLNSRIKSKDFDVGQWVPCYSPSQLSYNLKKTPKVSLVTSLMNEKTGVEHFLGEVSFDFDYRIKGKELLFELSNLEILKQF